MSIEALKRDFVELTSDAVAVGRFSAGMAAPSIVYVNDAFTKVFGYARSEILGTLVSAIHDPDTWDAFAAEVQEKFRSRASKFTIETSMIRADGSRFWASISFLITQNKDGRGRLGCATYRDITALKHAEQTAKEALRTRDQVHARLVAALNAYPDPIVIYDKDLKLITWNDSYANSMTNDASDLSEGMHLGDVLLLAVKSGKYPVQGGDEKAWVDRILSDQTLNKVVEDVELDGDVHHRLLRSRSSVGDYVVIRLNATELVRQKRAAENAEARLIAALNAYPSPFAIYDAEDRLVVWNLAYQKSMTDDPNGLRVGMHTEETARLAIKQGMFAQAIGNEESFLSPEHMERERVKSVQDLELAGDIHHRLLRSRVANGDLVMLRIDTTELVRQRRAAEEYAAQLEVANDAITHKALHDELTGLGNRRYLTQKFEKMIQHRQLVGGEIAALHIDLDRFKQINDTMGHAAGDKVLLVSSQRILACRQSDEVVARIGGDEFVVLLHATEGSDRPEALACELLEQLAQPTYFEGKECRFGASIGLARTPLSAISYLLTNSDVALYKAKHRGRGQLGIFDSSDLQELIAKKDLADEILRGIENEEFVPYYHVQVDAISGAVVGMEALARWHHPTRGVLTPDQFLAVATDVNALADIDRMIFERGIRECQEAFGSMLTPPSLSFNVSQRRVNGVEFEPIRDLVSTYSGQVCFELLETILLEEEDTEFLFQLDRLREIGIGIEVDDFGSGRASVVALQRIGPDRLKIDRRLVEQVAESESGARLVRSIVEIGLSLEMGITAEGVETQEQADMLARLGCDRLQGFLYAKPMCLRDTAAYLAAEVGSRWQA